MRNFKCSTCGKQFYSEKFDKNRIPQFCSKFCFSNRVINKKTRSKMSEARKGKIPWNKGVNMWKDRIHPKGMSGKVGPNKGKTPSQESKIKMRLAHLGIKLPNQCGKNHPQWKGGVTSENEKVRKSSDYINWRRKVFERDDFTCVFCYKKGGELNADHIMPFSTHPHLRVALDNGRTLCKSCHVKTDTYGVNKTMNFNKDFL